MGRMASILSQTIFIASGKGIIQPHIFFGLLNCTYFKESEFS